jgi:hypothetical protein
MLADFLTAPGQLNTGNLPIHMADETTAIHAGFGMTAPVPVRGANQTQGIERYLLDDIRRARLGGLHGRVEEKQR